MYPAFSTFFRSFTDERYSYLVRLLVPFMNLYTIFAVAVLFVLTAINAFFTLAETSLIAVRNARLQQLAAEGSDPDTVLRVQKLLQEPTRVFATVQVGITLASFGAAAITVAVLAPDLVPVLIRYHVHHPVRVAVTVSTLIAALFTIVVAELVPRAVGQQHPEKSALFIAWPLPVIMSALSGLGQIALWLSNLVVNPFGLRATFAAPVITEEELRMLVEASARSGAIEEDEKEIIRNVISFGDTDVRQVMTPRIDIKSVDVACETSVLLDLIIETGHSRIPMFEGSVDSIVGIVHAKDLLPALASGQSGLKLHTVMRPPLFVPENRSVDELMEQFKHANQHLAIVQDEYGGTAGLVTLEDLLEELVGEIGDEYDTAEDIWEPLDATNKIVDARMRIDELNEVLGSDIPTADYDTIGGFVFGLFGRQPSVGDSIVHDEYVFRVTKTDARSIRQIVIERSTANSSHGDAGHAEF